MRLLTLTTLLSALIARVTIAQDAPIEMIPASASIVIRLQAPETTIRDLVRFVDSVQPGLGVLAQGQAANLLRVFSNPDLTGLDLKQDWYIAYFADEDQRMHDVLLVPTTDVSKVKEAMGPQFSFAEKNGWLACSKSTQYREVFDTLFNGNGKSFAEILDGPTKSLLISGHLCVVVNGAAMKEAFADELSSADDKLERLLQTMRDQMAQGNPQLDLDYIVAIYRSLGKALLQGVRDSKSAAVAVTVTETALQIEELLIVEADSQTDAFFRSHPVSDMARLTSLPEGLTGYGAISGDPKCLFDWSGQMIPKMFREEEIAGNVVKSMALVRQAKFGTLAMGGDLLPDREAAMRYFAVGEISPASVVREAIQVFGTGMEYEVAGIRQKQSIEINAETIDGQSIDIIRTEQMLPPELDPTGLQKMIQDQMYGPGGMVQRIVIQEDLLLQTLGGGPESMKRLLTPANWSDSKLREARARQYDRANLMMLFDLPNIVLKFTKLLIGSGALPVPVQPEQLDGLKIAPSYAGFSVAVEKQSLHARTSIPVETFQGFVQMAMFVQQLRTGEQ